MTILSRRMLFGLPLALPAMAVTAAAPETRAVRGLAMTIETAPDFREFVGELKPLQIGRVRFDGFARWRDGGFIDDDWNEWSAADIADTLGIEGASSQTDPPGEA